jgi:hypothetical protein
MRSVNSKSLLLVIVCIGVAAIEAAVAWLLPGHDDTAAGIQSHRVSSEPQTQPVVRSTRGTAMEAQAPRTIQTSQPTTEDHIDWAVRDYTIDDYFDFVAQAAPEAQAYRDRDLPSVAYYPADELARGTVGDGAQAPDSAQSDLEQAVTSGDPAAIFHVGEIFLFAGTRYGASPVAGAALIIAGCDLGYDCSVNSPALDFYLICVSTRGCPPGFTYLDGVREALGKSKYAAAHSRAKQFEQALQTGDRVALRHFVRINSASRRDGQ